ncbi:MAG: PQQ-binding-like beta-propeller repeat protein [Bacteroidetes bacterium]|nr:PQQ-binding-like beta-propeller repeat protein [Bacteroidota bacterium]
MEYFKPSAKLVGLLNRIALSAGLFAFVICLLILVNYYQLKRSDPLNSPALKVLVEKMRSNPDDEQVKLEIRELDLLARKAFFTNRWQIRTGGYLLIFSILIIVICLKTIELIKPKIPETPGSVTATFWSERLLNRKWITYTGISLVLVSVVFAYLTHDQLGDQLERVTGKTAGKSSNQVTMDLAGSTDENPAKVTTVESSIKTDSAIVNLDGYPSQQELNSNFPYFRGPFSTGLTFQKNIPTSWDGKSGKNIKWKTAVPLPGYNSPVVWNDKVFLAGANASKKEVVCFDVATGKILWETPIEKIPGSPAQSPKVNAETGLAAPTCATDGRRVYAIFANGDLAALDFTGKVSWSKNLGLPKNHYGHSSSLITYHDLLIVQYDQSGDANVMAFNGKTGQRVWETSRDVKVSWSSPILVNTGKRVELILVAEPNMVAYAPATGKELWRIDCISGEVGPSAAYSDGIAFSVNEYSKLAAVQVGDTPKVLWESDEFMSDIPSPVASANYLFLATSYGTMICYDAKSGNKYWEKDFGTPIFASPMIADGKVFALDKKGIMHIFRIDKTYTSISDPPLGESSVCTPAFADGRIFIRGDKNLYCIGK